jgi:hypothetical protein
MFTNVYSPSDDIYELCLSIVCNPTSSPSSVATARKYLLSHKPSYKHLINEEKTPCCQCNNNNIFSVALTSQYDAICNIITQILDSYVGDNHNKNAALAKYLCEYFDIKPVEIKKKNKEEPKNMFSSTNIDKLVKILESFNNREDKKEEKKEDKKEERKEERKEDRKEERKEEDKKINDQMTNAIVMAVDLVNKYTSDPQSININSILTDIFSTIKKPETHGPSGNDEKADAEANSILEEFIKATKVDQPDVSL